MYYGQFDPPADALIGQFFPPGYVGACVEVGAVDGVSLSNSLHFEQLGWKCLCIEPNSFYHEALRRNRKAFLPYAISDKNEDGVRLHRVKIANSYEAVTSLELDRALVEQHRSLISGTDEILVDVRTLDFCLAEVEWTAVDFVTIDTEGTELSALKGFSLDRWRPKLLMIENNFGTPAVEAYLRQFGYQKVQRHVVNDFYTLSSGFFRV